MDSIRALRNQAIKLRQLVVAKRKEADRATQNSLDQSTAGDYNRAAAEEGQVVRLTQEIRDLESREIETERQAMRVEQHIVKLNQQEALIRDEHSRQIARIDQETKQRLDEIDQQVRALRG